MIFFSRSRNLAQYSPKFSKLVKNVANAEVLKVSWYVWDNSQWHNTKLTPDLLMISHMFKKSICKDLSSSSFAYAIVTSDTWTLWPIASDNSSRAASNCFLKVFTFAKIVPSLPPPLSQSFSLRPIMENIWGWKKMNEHCSVHEYLLPQWWLYCRIL